MKRKNIGKAVIATALSLSLILSYSAPVVYAAKDDTKSTLEDALSSAGNESVDKEETVYVTADTDGGIKNVIVSDHLKVGSEKEIKDSTDLKDIENVKGDEAFTQDGNSLKWKADGNDIYYQGTTTKDLPVNVKVSYTLDGKKISGSDLAGKSGKVTIRFDYTNKEKSTQTVDGKDYDVYTPYTVMSGMVLKEGFSNITVENGKVISSGNKNIVVGLVMPGLADSLKLDEVDKLKDLEIPEYVEVSADVKDFSLDMTMTVVLPDLVHDIDMDSISSFDDIEDKINQLTDGSAQLVDGTAELLKGAQELNTKFGEYSDGVNALVSGIASADTGISALSAGATQLSAGAVTLNTGAGSLAAGATQVSNGAKALDAGIDTFKTTYDAEVATSKQETAEYIQNTTGARIGQAVQTSLTKASSIAAKDATLAVAANVSAKKADIVAAVKGGVAANYDAAAVKAALAPSGLTLDDEQAGAVAELVKKVAGGAAGNTVDSITATITNGASDTQSESAQALAAKIATDVNAAANPSTDITSALTDLGTVLSNKTDASQQKVDAMFSVSDAYRSTGRPATIKDASYALSVGSGQVATGAAQLQNGSTALMSGVSKLQSGAAQLSEGSTKLKSGSAQIKEATGKLGTGINSLAEGTEKLNNGMSRLDSEGISKINDWLDEDFSTIVNRLKAVKQAGEEYKIFTKLPEGKTGSVRFIIETEGIKKSEDK